LTSVGAIDAVLMQVAQIPHSFTVIILSISSNLILRFNVSLPKQADIE